MMLRVVPAMAASMADEFMDISHIVRRSDQAEEVPKKRGRYKKKTN